MKIGGFKKKYKRARLMAVVMSLLMVLTLFGDVGYKPVADNATTPTAADFMKVVDSITVTPSSSTDTPLDYDKALDIVLAFTLPDDGDDGFDISTNYLYQFNINNVTAENKDGSTSTAVNALVNEQDESGLPIVMEGKVVGEYSIENGVVTLDFQKGIDILKDSTISRKGTFKFNCSLNQEAFANEGGEYVLKFDTETEAINPTIVVEEKEYIKSGVTVNKSDATFNANTQTATYTIEIENTSGGPLNDLIIFDTMGSNLTYVQGSVSNNIIAVQDGQNIRFQVYNVPTGKTTFTYTCNVTDGAFTGANSVNGGVSGTDNTITATLDGENIFLDNSSTKKDSTSISVKKDVLDKSYEGYYDVTKTVKWKIVINAGDDTFDLGGYTFTDTLGNGLAYVPGSVTVTGDGGDVVAGLTSVINGTSASYKFPEGTKGEYVIEYETTVPKHDGKVTYDNEATISNGTYTDTDKVLTDPIGEYVSSKEFAGDPANIEIDPVSGDLILPWKTTIKVPTNATSLVYNDFVNSWYDENGLGFVIPDGDLNNIFTVTYDGGSLTAGTDYTVEAKQYTTNSYNLTLTDEGLAKVKGKTIKITYETIGSYKNKPSDNGSVYKNHYELTIVDNGTTLKENGQAQTQYTPETIIDKWVSEVDAEKHTITWAIKVNASDTNVLNNLVLTDVMENMRYYGCPNGNDPFYVHKYNGTEPMKVYIVDSYDQKYFIEMTERKLSDSTEMKPKYEYTIDFSSSTFKDTKVWKDPSEQLTGKEKALNQEFTIYYTTKVEGENLYSNNTTNYKNDVTATVTVGNDLATSTYHATANKDLTTEILTKDCAQYTDDGVAVLTYTIKVNPDGLKLNPNTNQAFYTVEDTLPPSLIYIPDKTVIEDGDGKKLTLASSATDAREDNNGLKYHVSYADNLITFTVPDSKPLTITYKVTMLSDSMAGNKTYINSVKLAQPYVSNESLTSKETYRSVASSAANMVGRKLFIVDKLDALDTTKHLSGATFEATEYVYDANAYTWVLSGNVFEGTTAANGTVGADAFTVKSGDQNATISTNRIYEIRETVAPTGYDLTDKVYKIIVVDTDNPIDAWIIPGDTYRITAGTSLLFSDMPSTVLPENKLIITKKYYEANGTTGVTSQTEKAVIEIYEGNLTLEQCKSGSYTPLATGDLGNGFTYEKSEDDIILNRIPTGTYTVYEKSAPEGYDILTNVYHFTVSNYEISWENETAALEVSKVIANKKTFENEIVLHKTYKNQLGNTLTGSDIPENAKFTYKQTHYYDGTGYVEVANGTVTNIPTTDGFAYTLKNLPAGIYVIDEVESTVYNKDANLPLTVEINANGAVSIMNSGSQAITDADTTTNAFDVNATNVVKENKITVYKYYYDKAGNLIQANNIPETLIATDNETNQQKVKFTLWKKDGSSYVATAEATDYESYTTNFVSAPTDAYIWANLKPGEYKLTESLVTGNVPDLTVYETLHEVYFTVNDDYTISTNTSTTGNYEQTVDVVNRQLDSEACRFYLTKYIADQSGNAAVDTNGEGIKFIMQKKLADGSLEDVTFNYNKDKQRWEAVGLKAGEYVVKEVNTLTNYVSADTIEIIIDTDTNANKDVIKEIKYNGNSADFWTTSVVENIIGSDVETVVANVINRPEDNSITVTKKYYQPDEITEVPSLEKYAEFTLYELQGSDYVEVKTIEAGGNNTYKFDKLEPGSYKISETYTPTGYVKASDVEFTVKNDYTINVTSPTATDTTIAVTNGGTLKVDVTAKNVLNNSFTWTKKYTAIDGTAVEDTTNKDLLFGATEFTVYNAAGDTVVNGVDVDKDNSSYSFKVSNLTEGEYRIKETATPEGYVTSGDIIINVSDGGKISVTYSGTRTDFTNLINNNTYDVTASLYNRQDTNQLVITKEYYQADGTQIPLNEVLSFASFKIYDANDNEVTGVTKQFSQSTGTYVFSNIPQGSYKIKETPISGYKTIADLSFTVDVNGKISYTTGDGWSTGTNNAGMATVTAKNTKLPNGFTLRKLYYDASGADITNNHINSGNPQASFTLVATNGSGKTYTVNQNGNLYTVENIPYGTYELKETVPAGYKQVNGTITVNVAEDGTITASYTDSADDFHVTNSGTIEDMEILFTNHGSENSFTVFKTYVSSTGEEISTAELEDGELANFILYKYENGNRVEVDSSKVNVDKISGVYSFENLESGRYTIVEETGAGFVDEGNEINFTVNANLAITNVNGATTTANSDNYHKFVEIENERAPFDNIVCITKTFINIGGEDTTDDTMLQNTSFVMKDSDGNIVTGFAYDTTNKCWMVEYLEPGNYVISEVATPTGYIGISDINVTVTKTAPAVTEITVSYTGLNTNDVTYEYGITQGTEDTRYVEIKAINRQEVDNKFVIDKKFISVYGKEITSANVLATYLKSTQFTYKAEGGTNVANIPFDDTTGQYVLEDLQPGTYIISETAHSDFIAISDMKLVVDNDGSLEVIYAGDAGDIVITESQTELNTTSVEVNNYSKSQFLNISKVDITNGAELPGAKLTITNEDGKVIEEWTSSTGVHKMAVGGFIPNKEYTLTEVTAPYGYDIAESIVFKTDELGNIYVKGSDGTFELVTDNTIVMEDAPKYVTISKVDLVNGAELPGAKLTITDKDGKIVDTWTSTTTPHQMLMTSFKADTEYTLTEVTAPEGYEVAESIIFKIDTSGTIYIKSADGTFTKLTTSMIVMKDAPSATSSSEVETGDSTPIVLLFVLVMLTGLGIIYMMPRKRRI